MTLQTVGEARAAFFAANGFSAADYGARVVKIRVGPFAVPFPNSPARQRVVGMHDLHHLATGYDTSWVGEAEQAAWEIGAGCGRHVAAWALNLGVFGAGLALAPRRVFRAFVRGRHGTALYRAAAFAPEWLAEPLPAFRARLGADATPTPATPRDALAFAAAVALTPVAPALMIIGALAR